MSGPELVVPADTNKAQTLASDPSISVWVSANAGAGKTTVLARRVERLLLNGTDPSRILALTFTKAAAGEMANRVFKTLGQWAVMDEAGLREALTKTEGKTPTTQQLKRARTLFARALETPGGLKIQTIHAFCEALLHQFPLEANIPGHFTVMDESHESLLMGEARRHVILHLAQQPGSAVGQAMAAVMDAASETKVEKLLEAVVDHREQLGAWLANTGTIGAAISDLKSACGFSPNETPQSVLADTLHGLPILAWDIPTILAAWSKETTAAAAKARAALQAVAERETDPQTAMDLLKTWLMKQDGALSSRAMTKGMTESVDGLEDMLADTVQHMAGGLSRMTTLDQIDRTGPVLTVAHAMLARYQLAKRRAGLLDFDDLIDRAADLLTRKDARAWVLYKLDQGIDHLLVDEAQDTSARQWDIIRALVDEFFSGEGAREVDRTVFVVGDEKQSIYSFQGADPQVFAQEKRAITRRAKAAGKVLKDVKLNLSFRSTQDVLSAVDAVFAIPEHAKGVTDGAGQEMVHVAARKGQPGHVEVWDPFVPGESVIPDQWHIFPDEDAAPAPAVRLAQTMADRIVEMTSGERFAATGKPITPGHILVLVRSRDPFVGALNRALKDRGVPVAGADRLALGDHIAVQDLLALGQAVVTPQDDLSLAAALKSPVFGLTEDDLHRLARHGLTPAPVDGEKERREPPLGESMVRSTSLFRSLQSLSAKPPFDKIWQRFRTIQMRADAMPVYEFYALVLGKDRGRHLFRQRLGPEVEDVLDAFLDLTLAHETGSLPGLQAFVEGLREDSPTIKREMDQSAGQVRLMTVHAAKGLEAEVVFLVDRHREAWRTSHQPALYGLGEDGPMLWVRDSKDHGHITQPLQQRQRALAEEEYRRLLYVGMTRAKDQLIVCGYCSKKAPSGPVWHRMVRETLAQSWAQEGPLGDAEGAPMRYRWTISDDKRGPVPTPPHHEDEAPQRAPTGQELPGWLNHQLAPEADLPRPLSPSGAQALIEEKPAGPGQKPSLLPPPAAAWAVSPRLLGTVVHRLFEELPDRDRTDWETLARPYLKAHLETLSDPEADRILESLFTALDSPQLAPYLDPQNSRPEVPIMGALTLNSGKRPVVGTIDRMAVLADHVMLLDFKTGTRVPPTAAQIPADYITQMALYRSLVAQLYPKKPVRAALLYTTAFDEDGTPAPRLLEVDGASMDDALQKVMAL
ncbi:MAG: double-strand break repair helicase AddA [Pseudomonadota bacterium]